MIGVYLGVLLSQIIWTAIIASVFFPETARAWTEKKIPAEEFAAKLDVLMPSTLYWVALGLTCLSCLLFGVWLARAAKFAPLGHAVFAAMLVAISYLQFKIGRAHV